MTCLPLTLWKNPGPTSDEQSTRESIAMIVWLFLKSRIELRKLWIG